MSDTPIKEKKHLSIRLHIFISMIALCLGLMLVLWITGGVFLKQIYGFIKTRDIQHASTDITANLENDCLRKFPAHTTFVQRYLHLRATILPSLQRLTFSTIV